MRQRISQSLVLRVARSGQARATGRVLLLSAPQPFFFRPPDPTRAARHTRARHPGIRWCTLHHSALFVLPFLLVQSASDSHSDQFICHPGLSSKFVALSVAGRKNGDEVYILTIAPFGRTRQNKAFIHGPSPKSSRSARLPPHNQGSWTEIPHTAWHVITLARPSRIF